MKRMASRTNRAGAISKHHGGNPRKKKNPVFTGVSRWRWEAELNRCKRICSPYEMPILQAVDAFLVATGGLPLDVQALIMVSLRRFVAHKDARRRRGGLPDKYTTDKNAAIVIYYLMLRVEATQEGIEPCQRYADSTKSPSR